MQETVKITAEGVTLSGVRKDEDRMLTELWRRPQKNLCGGRRCKRTRYANSQAKGQSAMTPQRYAGYFVFFVCVDD